MAGKKQLRPVQVDEKPPPATVSDAIVRGSRLDELRAMRRVLAAHIDNPDTLARDLAALMRQAREISKEIEELEAQERDEALADSGGGADDAEWRPQAI